LIKTTEVVPIKRVADLLFSLDLPLTSSTFLATARFLDHTLGYGLKSMGMQAKLTALAVNLKRIAALVSFLFLGTLGNLFASVRRENR
jgi:hypothetical protein